MGEIRTERLLLRECRKEDISRISEIANNEKIANNMPECFPHPCTLEAAKKWFNFVNLPEERDKNFVIVFDGEIVGGVGFELKKGIREGVASLVYWLGEDYWGKGIGTEGTGAVVDYIFENFDVRRIDIMVFSWDIASTKVAKKFGFSEEGRMRNEVIRFGEVGDEIRYGLLRGEWEVLNDKIDDL